MGCVSSKNFKKEFKKDLLYKGPNIFGVVRLAQVNMELARVETSFSGLSPGKHGWSINEFGYLTLGAASTRKVFNPSNRGIEEPLGDLGIYGEAFLSGVKPMLRVIDLIGRSIVLYETQDKLDPSITAAVVARSAGVGENYKKLCTCDGTTIWESSNTDFTVSKIALPKKQKKVVNVPLVFVKGRLIGGVNEVLKLEEEGKLEILFDWVPKRRRPVEAVVE
ncbi:Copper chaperone for superoxide dismutase [Thalictrum thalictroides]|uniref:Copper chaperone for superoxide dismutase n=1 Tax=Thalictrum thalictroides TaxID=46969 RepID=A0A7J6WKQ6_THATH|nr:Copper chaperone for superoxide dismutase [Thalictrum thalictroides]